MSYKAICQSVMSQAEAEELGKWLAEYKVDIAGLAVYQVDVNGKRTRDDATAKTIKDTVQEVGLSVALAPVAIPIIGLVPPLAAILAAMQGFNLLMWGGLKKAQHSLNKKIPAGKNIHHTELEFGFAGVSAKRLAWSEYLVSIYAHKHQWTLTGLVHPEQLAAGARAGGYPVPWSQQARNGRRSAKPKTSRQTISRARRAWWRITDEF